MKEIGLTGGIGSGKTTVAKAIEALGYAVYYADDRAKALYDENEELKTKVKALVGSEIYDSNGKMNRPKLAALIFEDKALLAQINALVHPAVGSDFANWREKLAIDYPKRLLFKEAAILFEAGTYRSCDGILTVYAPLTIRLQRVQQRDHATEAQVRSRIANQWPDCRKVLHSDFVIYNDGIHPILPQINAALHYLQNQ